MVKRKTFPAYGNCSIALATEEMKDGRWAVVVTVTQSTDTAELNTDLPVTPRALCTPSPRPKPSGCEAPESGLIEHGTDSLSRSTTAAREARSGAIGRLRRLTKTIA